MHVGYWPLSTQFRYAITERNCRPESRKRRRRERGISSPFRGLLPEEALQASASSLGAAREQCCRAATSVMAEQGQPDMEPDMQPQLNGSVADEAGSSLEAVRRKGEGAYGCKHYRWVGCLSATVESLLALCHTALKRKVPCSEVTTWSTECSLGWLSCTVADHSAGTACCVQAPCAVHHPLLVSGCQETHCSAVRVVPTRYTYMGICNDACIFIVGQPVRLFLPSLECCVVRQRNREQPQLAGRDVRGNSWSGTT